MIITAGNRSEEIPSRTLHRRFPPSNCSNSGSFLMCLFLSIPVLNVAAGKAPMQISTEGVGIPQKAIDGSTSSFFTPDTCSITKPERVPWWYVNLLEPYMVQLVRLDFGKACCGKSSASSPNGERKIAAPIVRSVSR